MIGIMGVSIDDDEEKEEEAHVQMATSLFIRLMITKYKLYNHKEWPSRRRTLFNSDSSAGNIDTLGARLCHRL